MPKLTYESLLPSPWQGREPGTAGRYLFIRGEQLNFN